MNIVLLSTDLVTASRFDVKFDKTKPRPYNCNAFIIKSTRALYNMYIETRGFC